MAYYDRIARQWDSITGHHGGAFKRYVLNERLLARIDAIEGLRILELGAGNGYFMVWMLRRLSGQTARRVVVTDASHALIDLAQRHCRFPGVQYGVLDARACFPFADGEFDLILATMVFNEMSTPGLRKALRECRRVLATDGRLLATVVHPAFVHSLARRHELKTTSRGILTMPAAAGLRLPVFPRSAEQYEALLREYDFHAEREDVLPNRQVLHEKPGLRNVGRRPLALILDCTRVTR